MLCTVFAGSGGWRFGPFALGRRAPVWLIALALLWSTPAFALTLQVPAGGTLVLPGQQILCEPAPRGWAVDVKRRRLTAGAELEPGAATLANVAAAPDDCGSERMQSVTLRVTGDIPTFDHASTTLFLDAGRLELRGQRLEGVRIAWQSGPAGGADLCLNVDKDQWEEVCALGLTRNLPADPRAITLRFAPAGGTTDGEVITYDRTGRVLGAEQLEVPIGRVVLSRLFAPGQTVDVAPGAGRIEVDRPEAISIVQCDGGHCELSKGAVLVNAVPVDSTRVTVRVRLQPRVFALRGEEMMTTAAETFPVVRCPLEVVSGEPLRSVDDLQVLVRVGAACAKEADQLRWLVNGDPVDVARMESLGGQLYALLRVGRTARAQLKIAALRRKDGSVVAVVTEPTRPAPRVETSLILPGFGEIDFIPKNQDARITASAVAGSGRLVPISVPGAYEVRERDDGYSVRGVYTSGGYTSLHFAYRDTAVPAEFSDTSFGMLLDPVQRPIREASIPAPIGASSSTERPIVALLCRDKNRQDITIEPGTSPHIPFSERDSCRIVIYRDRIPKESGQQRIKLDVTVTTAGGAERPEARLSQTLILRHSSQREVIWIRGAKAQFDRMNIRVTHVIDESFYMRPDGAQAELPSAQWSVVTENASFKFYATATIPANLFRFSRDPGDLGTGPLALNFGVLSRLTWLDSDGREGIVGLEAGMMGMGLATDRDRHLAAVTGLGIAIPLGNVNQPMQAAVNIHAWASYSFGNRTGRLVDDAGAFQGTVQLSPWAFVFGPSITIGSVGAFL